jgi:hypothetical protein
MFRPSCLLFLFSTFSAAPAYSQNLPSDLSRYCFFNGQLYSIGAQLCPSIQKDISSAMVCVLGTNPPLAIWSTKTNTSNSDVGASISCPPAPSNFASGKK